MAVYKTGSHTLQGIAPEYDNEDNLKWVVLYYEGFRVTVEPKAIELIRDPDLYDIDKMKEKYTPHQAGITIFGGREEAEEWHRKWRG